MPVAVIANCLRRLFYRSLHYGNRAMQLALGVVGAGDSYAQELFVLENQTRIHSLHWRLLFKVALRDDGNHRCKMSRCCGSPRLLVYLLK